MSIWGAVNWGETYLLRGILEEMTELSEHGSKTSHLPEEPLVYLVLCLGIRREELSGLFSEIEEDGTALKDGNRFAVGAVGVDQGRDFVVGLI